MSCVLGGDGLFDTGDGGTLVGEGGAHPVVESVLVSCVHGEVDVTSLYSEGEVSV